jgi:hypothetical protein
LLSIYINCKHYKKVIMWTLTLLKNINRTYRLFNISSPLCYTLKYIHIVNMIEKRKYKNIKRKYIISLFFYSFSYLFYIIKVIVGIMAHFLNVLIKKKNLIFTRKEINFNKGDILYMIFSMKKISTIFCFYNVWSL